MYDSGTHIRLKVNDAKKNKMPEKQFTVYSNEKR